MISDNEGAMSTEVNKRVEAVGYTYRNTVQTLESKAHVCTPDPADRIGRCKFCPRILVLMPQGRTGELA